MILGSLLKIATSLPSYFVCEGCYHSCRLIGHLDSQQVNHSCTCRRNGSSVFTFQLNHALVDETGVPCLLILCTFGEAISAFDISSNMCLFCGLYDCCTKFVVACSHHRFRMCCASFVVTSNIEGLWSCRPSIFFSIAPGRNDAPISAPFVMGAVLGEKEGMVVGIQSR